MNTTINNNYNLFNYLNTLHKKELYDLSHISLYFDNYNHYKSNITKLNKYKKKDLINFIINNKEILIKNYLKLINKETRNNLIYILNKINKSNIFKLKKINKDIINSIENNHIGLTSIINDKIVIIIPVEFISILKKYINNRNIININKTYNKVIKYSNMLLNTYGLIDINNYKLFYNYNYLEYYLVCGSIFNNYNITSINGCTILYKNNLTIKYVEDTYLNEYIFKKICKKKIKNIYNLKYLKRKKYYKKYIDYISLHFIMDKKEIDKVSSKYLIDYINNSQIDIEYSKKYFKDDFKSEFEVSKQELELFITWFNKIYNKYPKWTKKGNK